MRHGIWLVTGLAVAACGPRYRKEVVGSSQAQVRASIDVEAAVSAAPGGGGVAIGEAGLHQAALSIALPRAMRVRYRLACPGISREGNVGESFEAYRQRRLAELRREREQKKQAVGAVAGAVLGSVGGGATVETPNAGATVEGEVSGEALGEAAADQALAEPELPAWDTGARTIDHKLELHISDPGVCALTLAAADDGVDATGLTGNVAITRLVDIKAEERARRADANRRAVALRADLHAHLVASGADPEKRARERAAAEAEWRRTEAERLRVEQARRAAADEARRKRDAERRRRQAVIDAERRKRQAVIDAERRKRQAIIDAEHREQARIRLEADLALKAELEARVRVAMQTRERVIAWLGECGGDRYKRQRDEQARIQRGQAVIRLSLDARARLVARLEGLGADRGYRARVDAERMREYEAEVAARRERLRRRQLRIDAARAVRAELIASLEASGAVIRATASADDSSFEVSAPAAQDGSFEVSAPAAVEVEVEGPRPPAPPAGVSVGVGVDVGGVSVGVGVEGGVRVAPVRPRKNTRVKSKRPAPAKSKAPVVRDHRRKK